MAAFTFTACGDDSNSGKEDGNQSAFKEVDSVDELGNCNKNKFGEIIYVAETDSLYECGGNGWAPIDSSEVEVLLSSSSDNAESSSSEAKSSSSLKADSSEVAKVEVVKVDSITVNGFAQKGPFASGSAVTVYELDSLYKATKTKFTGKVAGDSGAFTVEKIVLPSQFALVQVAGYYTNEITGKKTSGSKTTLNAIVDLSEGKTVTVNVNVLTELEYARVMHLVEKENFNVPAAKKRATAELLKLFGADADKKSEISATSISLSDTNTAGLALLSASILLQGDLSASKFGSRLSEIADLFAETGALDSAELRANLADWASMVDSTDNFESIRNNVKALNLSAEVPDFESILYAFWTKEYGLGECTAELEETLEKNTNKNSDNYGVGYACTSKRWHKSTALDTDLGLCTAQMEGSFKERKQEKKDSEYYVCRAGTWNAITETQFELKECTEKRELEYVKTKSEEYFICTSKQWKEIDAVTYELKFCTEKRAKEFAKTEKSGNQVCEWDGDEGKWREATELESELGVCGGNSVKADSIYKTKDGAYYQCSAAEWGKSDQLTYEMQDAGECTEKNDKALFETESLGLYVCDEKSWRKASADEVELGLCGESNQEAFVQLKSGEYRVCLSGTWEKSDSISFKLREICGNKETFEKDGVGDTASYYVCRDSEWPRIDDVTYNLSLVCEESQNETAKKYGEKYYACLNSDGAWKWTGIDALQYEIGICTKERTNTFKKTSSSKYYVCEDLSWNAVTSMDYELKSVCNADSVYKRVAVSGKYYECAKSGWILMTSDAFVDSRDGHIYKTVTVGKAVWMYENLAYEYKIKNASGDSVSYGNVYRSTSTMRERYYTAAAALDSAAVFSTNTQGCGFYGFDSLKTCSSTLPARGICPEGWHLPTSTEWSTMKSNVDKSTYWTTVINAAEVGCYTADGTTYVSSSTSSGAQCYWLPVQHDAGYLTDTACRGFQVGDYSLNFGGKVSRDYHSVRCVKD